MSKKELKTNAMRILDRMNIPYEYQTYECENFEDGIATADQLSLPHEEVYKTLVTQAKSGSHYVFVIPIEEEIDFKKAAKVVGEKSLEMIPLKKSDFDHRICPWRMYRHRHEKAVSNRDSGRCKAAGKTLCKRRKTGNAAETVAGGSENSFPCCLWRCHKKRGKVKKFVAFFTLSM